MEKKVTIFGYGSLMLKESALSTMPSLSSFRKARLNGFKRSFGLVSAGAISKGTANMETKEIAALSIEPDPDHFVLGCIFDIPESELKDYFEREHRYKPMQVEVEIFEPSSIISSCYTVVEQTDEEYKLSLGSDWESEYQLRVGQYYQGPLWGRVDIYPLRNYLGYVFHAALDIGGKDWVDNLLDKSYLADKKTPIRQYLVENSDRFSHIIDKINQ